ncbi:MAG: hypothetical protein ACLQBA_18355 [Candidatus Binataceae bacterium]
MTFRHAAALALVGWYLMIPPIGNDLQDFKKNLKTPLSTWIQDSAYDSAKDCEAAKDSLLEKRMSKNESRFDPDSAARFALATAVGKCVSSDDPRLAK